jgi:hypothetical protein
VRAIAQRSNPNSCRGDEAVAGATERAAFANDAACDSGVGDALVAGLAGGDPTVDDFEPAASAAAGWASSNGAITGLARAVSRSTRRR